MRPVMLVVGTRPEGIKMLPIYLALQQANIPVILCSTSQHTTLLADVFSVFNITPDIDLNIMKNHQDLFHITTTVLHEMKHVFKEADPALVLVQGDTTTVMATGMAAFYTHIPVGHVEAGLRTGDIQSPYPEEFNRLCLSLTTQYHFAPTPQAAANLLAEGKKRESVFCVGNTVVDALRIIEHKIKEKSVKISSFVTDFFSKAHARGNNTVLFTMHRRESFNGGILNILKALKTFAETHPDVSIMYPYHPNPHVVSALRIADITSVENIILVEPLSYKDLAYVLLTIDVVATDSGGIQEEAVSLGKKVLILREKSERMEGVWEGLAVLVGCNPEKFIHELQKALLASAYDITKKNIYGDGFAAEKIVKIIQTYYSEYSDMQVPLKHDLNRVSEERKL